jgi:DNA-binding LacI/PurR family transcriptional regulator
MSYSANVHAQRLASGRSRTLGIQIAGFRTGASGSVLLPDAAYFMDVLNGAASAAAEGGYALLLAVSDSDLEEVVELAIDGVIVVDPAGDDFMGPALRESGTPVVTTGRPTSGATSFPWVDNDHAAVARKMFDHFAARGYTRPAVVCTTQNRSYVADIVEAYRDWTEEHDAPRMIVELSEPPSERAAARAAKRLLTRSERPDAIYATYDRLALGVLLQAGRLGLSVPGDLALASAVESDALRWTSPHVTATFLDPKEIGREAVRLAIDMIEGRDPEAGEGKVVVPARIIARPSTARRPSSPSGARRAADGRARRKATA